VCHGCVVGCVWSLSFFVEGIVLLFFFFFFNCLSFFCVCGIVWWFTVVRTLRRPVSFLGFYPAIRALLFSCVSQGLLDSLARFVLLSRSFRAFPRPVGTDRIFFLVFFLLYGFTSLSPN